MRYLAFLDRGVCLSIGDEGYGVGEGLVRERGAG